MWFGKYASRAGEAKYPSLWRGLVGAWSPGITGPTGVRAFDLSGRNNHGTATNVSVPTFWNRSQGRWGWEFDGVNNRVETATTPRPQAITISVWVFIDYTNSDNFARVVEHGINNSITICLNKPNAPNGITLQVGDGNINAKSIAITFGSWQHVAATVSRNNGPTQLFTNGVFRDGNVKSSASNTTARWFFGGEETATTLTSLAGRIDDVLIHNRVLSPSEIRLLATRPGIAYEMAPRGWTSQQIAAYRRRQYSQLVGGGVI
jgi:hypothetical protein